MKYVCVRDCQFRKRLYKKEAILKVDGKLTNLEAERLKSCFISIDEAEAKAKKREEAEAKAEAKAEAARKAKLDAQNAE